MDSWNIHLANTVGGRGPRAWGPAVLRGRQAPLPEHTPYALWFSGLDAPCPLPLPPALPASSSAPWPQFLAWQLAHSKPRRPRWDGGQKGSSSVAGVLLLVWGHSSLSSSCRPCELRTERSAPRRREERAFQRSVN